MDTQPILRLANVESTYGPITAIRGISLDLMQGQIVTVLGANGAGKSTTLQAVSALLPARRGQITGGHLTYDGRDVSSSSAAQLVRAGLVPVLEGRHCFASLSVEENLITGAIGRDARRGEISADLDRIYALFPQLTRHRRSVAGLTSGGEQQMTAIGRALMSRPRLLVLDEPSMGLAPLVVEGIFRALKRLNGEEGLSILVAEQNSTVALRFADRAIVLEGGRSVLTGAARELRQRPDIKHLYLGGAAAPPDSTQAVA